MFTTAAFLWDSFCKGRCKQPRVSSEPKVELKSNLFSYVSNFLSLVKFPILKKAELFSCMHEENKPTISKLNICSQNYEKTLYTLTWHGWLNNCLIDRMLEKLHIVPPYFFYFQQMLASFFLSGKRSCSFFSESRSFIDVTSVWGTRSRKSGEMSIW